jgi:phenazine biosynthesis protein phzE
MSKTLLSLLSEAPERLGAFALLVRTGDTRVPILEIYTGDMLSVSSLSEVPLPPPGQHRNSAIAVVPYRQLVEREFACVDDAEPLRILRIAYEEKVPLETAMSQWPDAPVVISQGRFDVDDDAYADRVSEIVTNEIGSGAGSNFVLKRTFHAELTSYSLTTALTAFGRLVRRESGAYWTFLVHTGERTWIGASPERHISLDAGVATMNPISGTYRYPSTGPSLKGMIEFLTNKKENDELYMVVDEELKMMARFCKDGGKIIGPHLREMSRLAHTEYLIKGETAADPRDILRETLFSPAVTGSPIENACRVIAKYEPEGRGYYAGVLALFGQDQDNLSKLDSAILIRTADINRSGALRVSVGATIVRHSDPMAEAAETRTKATAVLSALGQDNSTGLSSNPAVISLLQSRNDGISRFWQADTNGRRKVIPGLTGRELLIIDAEDAFTAMLAQQLRAMGLEVTIARFDDPRVRNLEWDLAVFGPGPGDPHNLADPRIKTLRHALSSALKIGKSFLAVCLSHQLLCLEIGLPVVCRRHPNQGVQRQINYFGSLERVGFYNTFNAIYPEDELWYGGSAIEICRDESSHEVHALRGRGFSSIQFHAESILTEHGIEIISDALLEATMSQLRIPQQTER